MSQNEVATDIRLKTKQISDKRAGLDEIMRSHQTQIKALFKEGQNQHYLID